jgi:ribonuclease E
VRAPQTFVIDRGEQVHTPEAAKAIAERAQAAVAPLEEEDDLEEIGSEAAEQAEFEGEAESAAPALAEPDEGGLRRRRRRRRRGRGGGEHSQGHAQSHVEQIAITESADDDAEVQEAVLDEAPAEATAGFASEPHEGREGPRRDERRRRRGRRGGRRNRQRNGEGGYTGPDQSGHYPQRGFAPAEQLTAPAATEPKLSHAVADLDSLPDSPPRERAGPPEVSPVASPAAAAAQPETPRRRSTVREPVPTTGREMAGTETASGESAGSNPAPAASQASEPAITESGEASGGERPRRTGWWSRRFAGG